MHHPGAALSAVLSAVLRLPRCGNLSCPWRCPERSCDALLHSVLEVIVEPGALERSHLREVINEGGNQHAIHAIKALGCSHLERLIIVKVAPPLFLFGDSRGGTRRGTDLCPRRRHRQWSSRQPNLAKPAERPRRREQLRQSTLNTRVGAVRRRAWPLDAKEEIGREIGHEISRDRRRLAEIGRAVAHCGASRYCGARPEHHWPWCWPMERAHLQ